MYTKNFKVQKKHKMLTPNLVSQESWLLLLKGKKTVGPKSKFLVYENIYLQCFATFHKIHTLGAGAYISFNREYLFDVPNCLLSFS